jgi:hypothetical protein
MVGGNVKLDIVSRKASNQLHFQQFPVTELAGDVEQAVEQPIDDRCPLGEAEEPAADIGYKPVPAKYCKTSDYFDDENGGDSRTAIALQPVRARATKIDIFEQSSEVKAA